MIKNMEGVFILKCPDSVKDKCPMPVDDVFTSGATMMDKCAAEFKGTAAEQDCPSSSRERAELPLIYRRRTGDL
jgi:hypothetical protein